MKSTKEKSIHISVIVPVYNTGLYLQDCIESILDQTLSLEIILINDGSTDRSGDMMDAYVRKNKNIKVIHQKNRGLSASRNKGLEIASGEYIAFVDSDDWLKSDSLSRLYQEGIKNNADMIMGNILYHHQDKKANSPFLKIENPENSLLFSGRKGFCELMKAKAYVPMVCSYIYKREWIIKQRFYFHDLLHEDELWTPVALCQAERFIILDHDFYYYRQHEQSIMNTLHPEKRIDSLCKICDELIKFTNKNYSNDRTTYSWLYVRIYKLYLIAFHVASKIRKASYRLPNHHLYSIFQIYKKLETTPGSICYEHYLTAQRKLKMFRSLRVSPLFNIPIPDQNKIVILIYNDIWEDIVFPNIPPNIPEEFVVTTDRNYLSKADAVIFHIPTLWYYLGSDSSEKTEGQIWIGWSFESEENYPILKNEEFRSLFDLFVSYHQDSDIVFPYYRYSFLKDFYKKNDPSDKINKCCMIISSRFNRSRREEYLKELMKHTEIDSYGSLYKNAEIRDDQGWETKIETYSGYKFIIAFENSISIDYVTEKFFDPFLAGSVPIYLGAPNINEYKPGEKSFVDVTTFDNPRQLGEFINACYKNEDLYARFFKWKDHSLCAPFKEKLDKQKTHPFISLCHKIKEIKEERKTNGQNRTSPGDIHV